MIGLGGAVVASKVGLSVNITVPAAKYNAPQSLLHTPQPRQLRRHARQLRAHVVSWQADVDDLQRAAAGGVADGAVEFALGLGDGGFAAADELTDLAVVPLADDVECAVADLTHGAVALVVEDEDDRVEAQAR